MNICFFFLESCLNVLTKSLHSTLFVANSENGLMMLRVFQHVFGNSYSVSSLDMSFG